MKLIFGLAAVAGFASSTVSAYATFKHHDVRSLLFRLPPLRILQPTHSLSLFLLTVQQRRPRPGSFLPFLPFPMVCASYETGLISSLSFSFFFQWIVELSSVSAFSKRGEDDHLDPHDRFHSHMKRAGVNYDVVSTFNSSYLLGASISVSDSVRKLLSPYNRLCSNLADHFVGLCFQEIDSVHAMPSVMAVYPVRLVPRPEPYAKEVSRISGPAANPRDTL
jgi:hypothetical protein